MIAAQLPIRAIKMLTNFTGVQFFQACFQMLSFPTEIGGLPLGFLQLGKIIDEFSPIFPVAQLVKRQQCLLVALSYNGRSGGGAGPGLHTQTLNNYRVREFTNAQRRVLQRAFVFALHELRAGPERALLVRRRAFNGLNCMSQTTALERCAQQLSKLPPRAKCI